MKTARAFFSAIFYIAVAMVAGCRGGSHAPSSNRPAAPLAAMGGVRLSSGSPVASSDRTAEAYIDESWKRDEKKFLERMAQVQKGWSERQVIELLGAPREKSGEGWYYIWSEMEELGGMFQSYLFRFKDGVVAEVERSGGCRMMAPPEP